jgi:Tfp pilus assembly protein PilN
MAELIPLDYRIALASRARVGFWSLIGVGMIAIMGALVGVSYTQTRAAAQATEQVAAEVHDRSTLILESQKLKAKREALASRMRKIQSLMDDRVLLALLRNSATSFSSTEVLQSIHVHARDIDNKDQNADPNKYSLTIRGLTASPATLAELMTRLGKDEVPPVTVALQSSRLLQVAAGKLQSFQITCDRANTTASAN